MFAGGEFVPHLAREPVETPGRPVGERRDGTARQWGTEQLRQGLGGAFLGPELPDVQIHDDRGDARAVLDRGVHPGGCLGPGALPAHAFALHGLMPGHLDADRRQVELLAPLDGGDRPPGKRTPTTSARPGLVCNLVLGLGDLPQRGPVVAVPPTRLAVGLLPQRPRLRRRLGQPIRGRRSAGVARVRGQPRFQLGDARQSPLQLGPSFDQLLTKRNDQRGKHLI